MAYPLQRTVLGAVEILVEIATKLYDRQATECRCTESDLRPWPRSSCYHGK
jgi:hypothetical protein